MTCVRVDILPRMKPVEEAANTVATDDGDYRKDAGDEKISLQGSLYPQLGEQEYLREQADSETDSR